MRRLRRQNGEVVELTEAEFLAWFAMFNAIYNEPEPNYALAGQLSSQIDRVRSTLGRPPLGLAV